MRILVLNFEYPPLGGGASPVSQQLATRLSGKGHTITVVTSGYKSLPKEEWENGIKIIRVASHRKNPSRSDPIEHLFYLKNGRTYLKKLLKSETFDIIHCHFIIPTGLLAFWINLKYKIPYIITSHGSDLPGFNPDRFKFLHLFTPILIKKILTSSSFVVAPSNFLATLIEPYLREKRKMKVIPNGIDSDPNTKLDKKNIILSTGRLLKRKGFHTLIQAVSKLDFDYEVHICGDGPIRAYLEKLAQNSTLPVVFHGWIDNRSAEYITLLSQAKIFCLVSKFENASISLLEGMSFGCAVITSDVSGCPETVGDAGICIPPDDPSILAESLSSLIQSPERIRELGEQALQRAETVFAWNTIADKYEQTLLTATNL